VKQLSFIIVLVNAIFRSDDSSIHSSETNHHFSLLNGVDEINN